MPLRIRKRPGESWEDAARRYGAAQGLEQEVMKVFREGVEAGVDEATAAYEAAYEWDCLDFVPKP